MPRVARQAQQPPPSERFLSVTEAAAIYGNSQRWWYRHKEVPRVNVGYKIRYNEQALRDHFAAQALKH